MTDPPQQQVGKFQAGNPETKDVLASTMLSTEEKKLRILKNLAIGVPKTKRGSLIHKRDGWR